ncbi:hypothetical protein PCANC_27831 [Puccinia coronata f. sp. avenae]|uniref:Uncharacterized protein n=1 Tax=Puccinia coronata f. sp. avenae TaxID=200324 RepID=A0A2N5S720_9BASI|nr:hypothetical protein PCANC_27831 [Puccinia coronata f. sp. avenae]
MSSLNPHSIDVRVNAILHIIKRFVPKIKLPAAMSKENAIGFFQKIHLSRSAGTASINWSNTPVQAVLNPPCLTSDWTGVSDRLGKALVGHAGPITGQMRRFNRCLTRPVQPANAGRARKSIGQTLPSQSLVEHSGSSTARTGVFDQSMLAVGLVPHSLSSPVQFQNRTINTRLCKDHRLVHHYPSEKGLEDELSSSGEEF